MFLNEICSGAYVLFSGFVPSISFHFFLIMCELVLGDDWQAAHAVEAHPFHLLHPIALELGLEKALTDRSARLPL